MPVFSRISAMMVAVVMMVYSNGNDGSSSNDGSSGNDDDDDDSNGNSDIYIHTSSLSKLFEYPIHTPTGYELPC